MGSRLENIEKLKSGSQIGGKPMDSKKIITIYDIAKEAGVSTATVSRVLTNSAKVSQEKKEKIEALIEKYEFKPNAMARGLSETKSKIIGIIAADIRNPFYATLFVECEREANNLGYTVLLCNSLGENELEDRHLQKLFGQRVEAIVQMGGRVDELVSDSNYVEHVNKIASRIPVVITGKLDGSACYQVNIDEGQAMEKIMEYLISLGHRKIALVGGRKNVKSTVEKRSRYKELLGRYNMEFNENYIVEGLKYDNESGYDCMNRLFEVQDLPSAVIAINDFTAVGIIRAITERGLSIPKNISVASFDNTYISEVTIPKLTAIGYDYRSFGSKIIQTAIKAINGEEISRVNFVGAELVVRDSCK